VLVLGVREPQPPRAEAFAKTRFSACRYAMASCCPELATLATTASAGAAVANAPKFMPGPVFGQHEVSDGRIEIVGSLRGLDDPQGRARLRTRARTCSCSRPSPSRSDVSA
jgi:hypothetical protein